MKKAPLFICLFICLCFIDTSAQYSILLNFNGINGESPYGDLSLSGKKFYGMTFLGGVNNDGCIFSIDTNGNGYKDIFDFNRPNSAYPYGSLTISGSKMYGMTSFGGGFGNVFSIDTSGSGYIDLYDFNDTTGNRPYGNLTLLGGKLFGMTQQGGLHNLGCVFSIDTNGGGYKKIFDFNGINGDSPLGNLIFSGGLLYGMTGNGWSGIAGNIFSIDTDATNFNVLWDFRYRGGSNGEYPYGSLTLSGKLFYGMTNIGGRYEWGNIFVIDTNGNGYKDLWDFKDTSTNGSMPEGNLTLSGRKLYGMTSKGGVYDTGIIFSIDTNGSGFKKLLDFDGINGALPWGDLTLLGGNLYGMAKGGGADSDGVIFKIDTNAISTASVNNIEASKGEISVYPNPNNGNFTLILSNVNTVCSVEIYNMLGEKVFTESLPQNQSNNIISLTRQPSGVYFYRVLKESGEVVESGKLIVQH